MNYEAALVFHVQHLVHKMHILSIIRKRKDSIVGEVKLEDVIEGMPMWNW